MVRKMGNLSRVSLLLSLLFLVPGCAVLGSDTLEDALVKNQKKRAEIEVLIGKLKAHYDQGEKHYSNGDLDAAEVEYSAMLTLKNEEENALYRLGSIAYRRGEYAKSADYFERTIAANPRHGKAHYNLASIRLMQAESHFKYFAATADRNANLEKVSRLLGHIDAFAVDGRDEADTQSLDRIAGALKK
jgi:outer membrane protein assembly factor BamD (BamD/ComL family)